MPVPKRIRTRFTPSSAIEYEYRRSLLRLVHKWEDLYVGTVDPYIEQLVMERSLQLHGEAEPVRKDGWSQNLDTMMDRLKMNMEAVRDEERMRVSALDIGQKSSEWHDKKWRSSMTEVIGVRPFASDTGTMELLNAFADDNITLIMNLEEYTYSDIHHIVSSGVSTGRRHENIRRDIISRTDLDAGVFRKVENRAKLIARDQVAKLNGQINMQKQLQAGVELYIWHNVDDERVRASHDVMEDKICRWDDATVYKDDLTDKRWKKRSSINGVEKHPAEDYQCRCFAEPLIVDLYDDIYD